MRAIDEALASPRNGAATLFGMAGSGKTAMALEYAHRAAALRLYSGGAWWLSAEGSPGEALAKQRDGGKRLHAAIQAL